jgi:hypothetical protein
MDLMCARPWAEKVPVEVYCNSLKNIGAMMFLQLELVAAEDLCWLLPDVWKA